MEQYGAHIVATTRRAELAADAAASRLAAAARTRVDEHRPAPAGRPLRATKAATA